MKFRWIGNYVGTQSDDEGRNPQIRARSETKVDVTFLVDGLPMLRPSCRNKPAEGLIGARSPRYGPDLDIDLGRPGLSPNVSYEPGDSPDPNEPERLSVGVCRFQSGAEAEKFIRLFGKTGSYRRIDPKSTNGVVDR
jgi:hypothetical protein